MLTNNQDINENNYTDLIREALKCNQTHIIRAHLADKVIDALNRLIVTETYVWLDMTCNDQKQKQLKLKNRIDNMYRELNEIYYDVMEDVFG